MKTPYKTLMTAAIVLIAVTATYAFQAPAPPAQETKMIVGKLSAVDLEKKTINVQVADGKAMTFLYNERTEITGSDKNIQGLANSPGTNLRIHYREQQPANLAVKFEVLPGS